MNADDLEKILARKGYSVVSSHASHAKGSVCGIVKRPTCPNNRLDASILHPVPESLPREALERHAPAQNGGEVSVILRPRVHFTLKRVALLDPDNKWASVKFILDAMRYAGLIPNDRECDIELIVTQVRVASFNLEGTGVEINYPKQS